MKRRRLVHRICLTLLLTTLGAACERGADYPAADVLGTVPRPPDPCTSGATTLPADTAASVVRWTGTKFGGRASHAGTVRVSEGHVEVCGSAITGGSFTLDMRSIEVTDIPEHEPIPRERLRRHLMHEHFFAVADHPTATFRIAAAEPVGADSFRMVGELALRGRSRAIAFGAHVPVLSPGAVRASARFGIDRQLWGVAYRGSELINDLVDDEIYLDVRLATGE